MCVWEGEREEAGGEERKERREGGEEGRGGVEEEWNLVCRKEPTTSASPTSPPRSKSTAGS